MNSRYFPSIYDDRPTLEDMKIWAPTDPVTPTLKKSNSSTVSSTQYLNGSTAKSTNGCADRRESPTQKDPAEAPAAWQTGRLAARDYRALEAFSPPAGGPDSPPWSEEEVICDLCIRLKQMELCAMIGENLDIPRYQFLRNIKYYKVKQMRNWK